MDNYEYNKLRVMSYNCHGYSASKLPYVSSLLTNCDILFLQEHWLSDNQLNTLNNINSTHLSTGTVGFGSDDLLLGRPYGGCAIFWPANLKGFIHFVDTSNKRICSIRICNEDYKLLLVNVYMPYESDNNAYNEYVNVLTDAISLNDQFPDHCLILGGDFNVDFNKHKSHSQLLLDTCVENNLRIATLHECCDIDFTYNFCMTRFSFIDHFIVSTAVYDTCISECTVRHDGDNLSDHDPIMLSLNIDWNSIALTKRQAVAKIAWGKASSCNIDDYKRTLRDRLGSVLPPSESLSCHNVMCRDKKHIDQLNNYSSQIIQACLESATSVMPSTSCFNKCKTIPGWNEHVSTAREKSILWHNIWLECGKPRDGLVANIMRRTRAAYHYAVRYVKQNNSDIVRQRFASAIIENRNRDFWAEVKKVCGKTCGIQRTVDGHTQSDLIANVFANKYDELYTSVGYDGVEMDVLKGDIEGGVCTAGYDDNCIIRFVDIEDAVSKLKPGKHDGKSGLSSDHVKNACDELYIHIAILLSALVVHGCVTDDLAFSTILPIPKGKNLNYTDSTNYRGIALSSIVGKLFDLYVLSHYESFLTTSSLQFGFKRGHSTSMCTMVLKETIDYYRLNGNDVYCTMLDATKAFDRVEYCKLIRLLLLRKLPVVIIRFILNMYLLQYTSVAWNGSCSRPFRIRNGVRQGAVLSPVLFCIYFDELIQALVIAKYGCYIGLYYVGALAYADDIVLLAPSANATRNMLRICDKFGERYSVVFNASKSKCLFFSSSHRLYHADNRANPVFCIGGSNIEFVKDWPHLGHIISTNCDDEHDIMSRRRCLINQINNILCNFRNVDCNTKTRLIKAYCTSFYGSELWDLSNQCVDGICIAWRRGIRQVWRVPITTHSSLIPGLCKTIPLIDLFHKRMLKFIYRCLRSQSSLVNFVARHSILYCRMNSTVGRNATNFCLRYNTTIDNFINCNFNPNNIDSISTSTTPEEYHVNATVLNELIQCRDGILCLSDDSFCQDDVAQLIASLCTS